MPVGAYQELGTGVAPEEPEPRVNVSVDIDHGARGVPAAQPMQVDHSRIPVSDRVVEVGPA